MRWFFNYYINNGDLPDYAYKYPFSDVLDFFEWYTGELCRFYIDPVIDYCATPPVLGQLSEIEWHDIMIALQDLDGFMRLFDMGDITEEEIDNRNAIWNFEPNLQYQVSMQFKAYLLKTDSIE